MAGDIEKGVRTNTITSNGVVYLPFDNIWKMRIDHPYSLLVRDGDLIWSCGQCPLDAQGSVLHPGDLLGQTRAVIGFISRFMGDIGAEVSDIARLTLYYVRETEADTAAMTQLFAESFGPEVLITAVPVPYFYYDGMRLEVDVFGSLHEKHRHGLEDKPAGLKMDIVDAGPFYLVNLEASRQSEGCEEDKLIHAISDLLEKAGTSSTHLFSETWYIAKDQPQSAVIAAGRKLELCRDKCGVVIVPALDGMSCLGQLCFSKTDVTHEVFTFEQNSSVAKGVEINLTRSGSHFYLSACDATGADGVVCQTEMLMKSIADVLPKYGLGFEQVRKATTYYVSGSSAEELHENMAIRNRYYRKPGPASTGLPVSGFLDSEARISISLTG